jgi:hypothetical protein
MLIAIPLFDRFTALDAVGPFQVLVQLPGATNGRVRSPTSPAFSPSA